MPLRPFIVPVSSVPCLFSTRTLAGHSHYHNTRHRKAAVDRLKHLQRQRLLREIRAALNQPGGADIKSNPRLSRALQNARRNGLPKDRIARALNNKRTASGESDAVFEATLPGGVGLLIRAYSGNRSRVAGELRAMLGRAGGGLEKASWMFDEYVAVVVSGGEGAMREEVALLAMEEGAVDVVDEEGVLEVVCEGIKDRERIKKAIAGIGGLQADKLWDVREMRARTRVKVEGEDSVKVKRLLERLGENEDVLEVVHNAEMIFSANENE